MPVPSDSASDRARLGARRATVRRVGIVGAGVSGLVTARVLMAAGFEVVVYERAPDVGGAWSATRAYPGISTQDDRRSYTFSDARMPRGVEEHPTGAQVREYLEAYALQHGLTEHLRLGTTVRLAEPIADGWRLHLDGPDGSSIDEVDQLVAANGVFSSPHVPSWPGRAAFEAAGGRVLTPSDLGDGAALDGAQVAVVGWGKTACDLAVVSAVRARSTAVVARTMTWKYPKRLLGRLTFHHLVLTRAGERLIAGAYRSPAGRLLLRRLPERVPRELLGRLLARVVDRATGLSELGLRPALGISASTSLVSDGFFEGVRDGRIRVHRERTVAALGADDRGPLMTLSDGTVLRADVVVAATGYEQRLDFLPADLLERACPAGELRLRRRVLAVDVPRLAFVGWAHAYRSPLTAEVAAIWLAGVLLGLVEPTDAPEAIARFRVSGLRGARRNGQLPGASLRELDAMLEDLKAPLPAAVRWQQWVRPVDPADYSGVLSRVLARVPRSEVPALR